MCYLIKDISWSESAREWEGIQSIFAIERTVKHIQKETTTKEISYYISSLSETPERFLEIVREHWKIESMHWMLDVVFHEDDCLLMTENAQKSLNILRKLAISMHKKYKEERKNKKAMKQNMFSCLLNDQMLLDVLTV